MVAMSSNVMDSVGAATAGDLGWGTFNGHAIFASTVFWTLPSHLDWSTSITHVNQGTDGIM